MDLEHYFKEVGRTVLLTPEEEKTLAKRMRHGDQVARDHMIRANLQLVTYVAKRYLGKGVPLEDLIGEGNLGLIRAVDKFDPARGRRFSTYATWWITHFIQRGIVRFLSFVHVPLAAARGNKNRRLAETAEKIRKAQIGPLDVDMEDGHRLPEDVLTDRDQVEYLIQVLNERESKIVKMRYGHRMKLPAIGKEFSLSKERIRQIAVGGLNKMREYSETQV